MTPKEEGGGEEGGRRKGTGKGKERDGKREKSENMASIEETNGRGGGENENWHTFDLTTPSTCIQKQIAVVNMSANR